MIDYYLIPSTGHSSGSQRFVPGSSVTCELTRNAISFVLPQTYCGAWKCPAFPLDDQEACSNLGTTGIVVLVELSITSLCSECSSSRPGLKLYDSWKWNTEISIFMPGDTCTVPIQSDLPM